MHLYNIITVLRVGFAAQSYSGSEGGFVELAVRIISGVLSVGLTASVRFKTVDGIAVGELCAVCANNQSIIVLVLLQLLVTTTQLSMSCSLP